MNTNDGGPAFPRSDAGYSQTQDGISARDYFAAHALVGIVTHFGVLSHEICEEKWFQKRAFQAYAYADAMLVERAKAK